MAENFGKITQVIGPVVDIAFEDEGASRPPIYTALSVQRPDGSELILEVEQHVGENTVRCVAMDSTDGLKRGARVKSLGQPISVPTGDQIKGRLLNVIGQSIDHLQPLAGRCTPSHPSARSPLQRPVDLAGDPVHRYQGHRPDRALQQGW